MEKVDQYVELLHIAYGDKFDKSGIYGIYVCNQLVYIGKSKNIIERIANHLINIELDQKSNKYKQLRKCQDLGIQFEVLEETEDIDFQEAKWINEKVPILNYQIPELDNPKCYKVNRLAKTIQLRPWLQHPHQLTLWEAITWKPHS